MAFAVGRGLPGLLENCYHDDNLAPRSKPQDLKGFLGL